MMIDKRTVFLVFLALIAVLMVFSLFGDYSITYAEVPLLGPLININPVSILQENALFTGAAVALIVVWLIHKKKDDE
jgi:hypothetical protein